jgi:hypothetical protein
MLHPENHPHISILISKKGYKNGRRNKLLSSNNRSKRKAEMAISFNQD